MSAWTAMTASKNGSRCGHRIVLIRPPSMTMSVPVMLPAVLLARNTTRSATSSGRLKRPVAVSAARPSMIGLGVAVLTCADRAGDAVFAEPQPGLDRTGADGVDADAVWSDLFGERLGEVGERGFCGAVVDDGRVWEEGVDRADGDDVADTAGDHGAGARRGSCGRRRGR